VAVECAVHLAKLNCCANGVGLAPRPGRRIRHWGGNRTGAGTRDWDWAGAPLRRRQNTNTASATGRPTYCILQP